MNALLFSIWAARCSRAICCHVPAGSADAVTTFYRRVPYWQGLTAFCAAAFVYGLFVNPPYGFAPEDNLTYARVVRMQVAGIAQLTKRYSGATVLSAWPVTTSC